MTVEGIANERVTGYELDVDAEGGPDGSTGEVTTWRVSFYVGHRPPGSDRGKEWSVSVRVGPGFPLAESLSRIPHAQSTLFAATLDEAKTLAVAYAELLARALSALREHERGTDRLGLAKSAVSEFVIERQ